jgi:tetratricopeptide (TPR) repeat protein
VTNPLRLVTRSLAILAFALVGTQAGAASFSAREPSVTGSYLAGTQALFDLRTDDAARYMRDALTVDWDNPLVMSRAYIAFAANGEIDESAETAKRLLAAAPEHDLAHLVIAARALKERRYDAAIADLTDIDSDSFAGITGSILKAWALVGAGRAAEADRHLDELAQSGLEDFLVFHRALMAEVAGDNVAAIDYARIAYESDPFVARIVEAYARMLGNAGRFDEASDAVGKFFLEGYTHPLVASVAEAIEQRRRPGPFASSPQVGAAEMFHGIGVALARDGSADIAIVFLRLGLYLDPRADVIALVLGQLLDDAGNHEAANDIYDRIAAASPMKPTAVIRVAENLDSMGQRDEALRRLGNIARANPDDLEALSVLGDLQRTAELYGEAADTYTRALQLTGGDRPGDWRFYYVRGIAYERNKEWPKAEADFQRALELRPDQPQVLNYLGYTWVDQGVNLVAALEMIEKAVEAAPRDGYIVDSLGWAFYRLGRYEEAVEALERAVQLRPNDAEINDHLGDAYWRAGRQLEARFQWTIAAYVDEEGGDVVERVKPKLANGLEPLPVPAPGSCCPSRRQPRSISPCTSPAAVPTATTSWRASSSSPGSPMRSSRVPRARIAWPSPALSHSTPDQAMPTW